MEGNKEEELASWGKDHCARMTGIMVHRPIK